MMQKQLTSPARPLDFVSTPAELAIAAREFVLRNAAGFDGPTFGHADLDRKANLWDESMTALVARPGHGKTMMLKSLARREALKLQANGARERCVVFLSLEEPREKIAVSIFRGGSGPSMADYLRGGYDAQAEADAMDAMVQMPVWIIQQRAIRAGQYIPGASLTVELAYQAVVDIEVEYGLRPSLILIDYLQILRAEKRTYGDHDRQALVSAAAEGAKELAMTLRAPVVLGVQAARATDSRETPMPMISDLQWSSSIEQVADLVLGLWRPCRTKETKRDTMHTTVDLAGQTWPITDDLIALQILKQRHGEGYGTFAGHLDPRGGDLSAMEPRSYGIPVNAYGGGRRYD